MSRSPSWQLSVCFCTPCWVDYCPTHLGVVTFCSGRYASSIYQLWLVNDWHRRSWAPLPLPAERSDAHWSVDPWINTFIYIFFYLKASAFKIAQDYGLWQLVRLLLEMDFGRHSMKTTLWLFSLRLSEKIISWPWSMSLQRGGTHLAQRGGGPHLLQIWIKQ
jgi:hypothetical protein